MDFLSIKKDFCHMPLSCVQKCKLLFCESYSWSCVCVCFSERFYSAPSHFLFINVFFSLLNKKSLRNGRSNVLAKLINLTRIHKVAPL